MTVCAEGETLEGIDVSYYQGSIDWDAVAADGIQFAITRVNHGSFMDPEFAPNWQGIRDVGLIRGAYQYFDPGGDPVEQANTFIDQVGQLGPGDLPGVIDVESTDGLSPSAIAANVATWIELVAEGTGREPIIYTGSYFWNDNVQTDAFNDHPLWIAHYTTGCPNVPDVWSDWAVWQYTSSGSVAGIGGNVDRNEFNGTFEQLNDFAGNGLVADIVSVDYPSQLAAGERGTATVVLDNIGARTWTANTKLATSMPRDRSSVFVSSEWDGSDRVMGMPVDVPPGDTVTLTFEVEAPVDEGEYIEHFNLVEEGLGWFSDTPPGGGPADDAIALTITVDGEPQGAGGTGAGGEQELVIAGIPSSGDDASCSVGRADPDHTAAWWLLALSAAAKSAARRRCRRRGRRRQR